MIQFAGYVAFLLLLLLLVVIFSGTILVEIKACQKALEKEKAKVKILNELLTIANKVNKMDISEDAYPLMTKYLSQARYIIIHHPFSFDSLSISLLKDEGSERKQAFCAEYINAPTSVQKKVNELSSILGKVYGLQHPVRYKWENATLELKKKMALRILVLLDKISDVLNKSIDRDLQKKMERKNICDTINSSDMIVGV